MHSRITLATASLSRRKATAATTGPYSTVREKPAPTPRPKLILISRILPLPKRKEHPRRNRHQTGKCPHWQRLVRPSNPIPSLLQLHHLPGQHLRLRSLQRLRQSRVVQQPLRQGQLRRPDERMLRHGPGRCLRQRGQFLREQGREYVRYLLRSG